MWIAECSKEDFKFSMLGFGATERGSFKITQQPLQTPDLGKGSN